MWRAKNALFSVVELCNIYVNYISLRQKAIICVFFVPLANCHCLYLQGPDLRTIPSHIDSEEKGHQRFSNYLLQYINPGLSHFPLHLCGPSWDFPTSFEQKPVGNGRRDDCIVRKVSHPCLTCCVLFCSPYKCWAVRVKRSKQGVKRV